jgi:hypothetical protein
MLRRLARAGWRAPALVSLLFLVCLPVADAAAAGPKLRFSVMAPGARSVKGTITFAARNAGPHVQRVEFIIDGHRRWMARRRPFRYDRTGKLNTHHLRNGAHTLKVVAFTKGRPVASAQQRIVVSNHKVTATPTRVPTKNPSPGPTPVTAVGSSPSASTAPGVVALNRETYAYSSAQPLAQDASHYQVLVLQATDGAKVAALHAANPNLKILVYQHPWYSRPSDPAGWTVCTSYPSDAASHPDWFLHDAAGHVVPTQTPGNFLMDPANPSYQQTCFANSIALAKRYGFDGIYLDQINSYPVGDAPGTVIPEYPTNAAWQSAMTSLVTGAARAFHGAGLLAFGNLGATQLAPGLWQQWAGILDGAEEESWTGYKNGFAANVPEMPQEIANVAWSESHGKYTIVHSYSTTEAGNTYGLAAMLLAASGHTSYSTSNDNYTAAERFFPEETQAQQLGLPTGSYFRLANGVFERVFQHGIVLVNPTNNAVGSFSLGGGHYSGSQLTNVTSVAMAATSGLILLRQR